MIPGKSDLIPNRLAWSGLIALGFVTTFVYAGVLGHDFVDFDDPMYVTANFFVQRGLEAGTVLWALTDTTAAHYWHPLTWLSHMADVEIHGSFAGGHLATNVALHLGSTFLLWATLTSATGRFWESLAVAALFALHPQHVESVAWVAERKDVLSTFFFCLALLLHVRYAHRPSLLRLLAVYGVFLLGLAAKPLVITLPAVLLLLDYWPLRRAPFSPPGDPPPDGAATTARLLLEKAPLFVLAIGVAVLTVVASDLGGMFEEERLPWSVRVAHATCSYVLYLVRTVWPFGLAAFYPHPGMPPSWAFAGSALLLVAVSIIVVRHAREKPHWLVGWLWYLGTFLPVIQLIQAGRHGMADRYTYIPLIGIFLAVAWEVGGWVRTRRISPRPVAVATAMVLTFFAVVSWRQVSYWENTQTLFERAVEVTEDNYFAHALLGQALMVAGQTSEGEVHFREVLRIRPGEPNTLINLGLLLADRGDTREALVHLREAQRTRPILPGSWFGLGYLYEDAGRLRAAERQFRGAVRYDVFNPRAHVDLGRVLERQGKLDEAARRYRRALRLDPAFDEARRSLERVASAESAPGDE